MSPNAQLTLGIFGAVVAIEGLLQVWTLFVLSDIRDRIVRLENRAMNGQERTYQRGTSAHQPS